MHSLPGGGARSGSGTSIRGLGTVVRNQPTWEVRVGQAHIVIASAGAAPERVRQLVDGLVRHGLGVVLDPTAGGQPYIGDFSFSAAAVVIVWGAGPPMGNALSLAERAAGWSSLIPVKLDANATFPASADALHAFDLSGWDGGDNGEFERLITRLQALVEHPVSTPEGWALDDPSAVVGPRHAIAALQELTGRVGRLVEVLAGDARHTQQLRETLHEIGGTYRVVQEAIAAFVAAGLKAEGVDRAAFAKLERAGLASVIRNGRGHCTRIGARYFMVGGMRDALTAAASAEFIAMADQTFATLTQSDMDMFAAMDRVGETLTTEARHIVRLLLEGQERAARQRIAQAREVLLPLEDDLDAALAAFQEIETSLGYAEDSPIETEAVHVSIQSIYIGGDAVNTNIVAAHTIENSAISLSAATGVSEELKAFLTELHKAVGALTAALPDDEAELAAGDLEELTKQAMSGSPRPAFWRRAVDGLLAAAKKAADVGGPVVDLVTKVAALLA